MGQAPVTAAAHPNIATVATFRSWRGSQVRDCTESGA
jgi:hypothetical protein